MTTAATDPPQIPLPFRPAGQLGFDLYCTRDNDTAVRYVREAAARGSSGGAFLWGAPGTGKSHLLNAACLEAAGAERHSVVVPFAEHDALSPDLLQGLEQCDLVCMDDVDRIAGVEEWEEAVFHLVNRVRDRQGVLLASASSGPAALPLELPDLRSRFAALTVFHLKPLAEPDRRRALQQRAALRGMELGEDVLDYLIRRVPRDMHSLFGLLDRLDTASLAAQRRLTVPFVRGLLSDSNG